MEPSEKISTAPN